MAWATCTECGDEVWWRNRRGARLADHRCACGGTLRASRAYDAEPRRTNAGKKAVVCPVCGKRRYGAVRLVVVREPGTVLYWRQGAPACGTWAVSPGDMICRTHVVRATDGRVARTEAPQ